MRFCILLTMVQLFADAGLLSSAIEKNELLTLAYYVDEMVCLIWTIVRFRNNMNGTLTFILLNHFGRIPSTATSIFETDVGNKMC